MLQDLDTTLGNMLHATTAPAKLTLADASFATPDKTYAPQLSDTAINLFLYDVHENRELRDQEPVRVAIANRFFDTRPPIRVDCTYLVTAWSKQQSKVMDEHELLGLAFAYLSRFDTIPEVFLAGSLIGQPFPPPSMIAQWDSARNVGEFWSALGIAPRPAFNLVVTIAMDLQQQIDGALVSTVITGYHPGMTTPTRDERISIGGTVFDASGVAARDVWVRLEPDGTTSVTDGDGRFTFPNVQAGISYTLRARAPGLGEATRTNVDVSVISDYNVHY